jgi:Gluconate 2-dehydrogenase subunit 3
MSYLPSMDRRTTLKWMLAGLGTAPLVAACGGADGPASSAALLGQPGAISGVPYGADPDMLAPSVTWSRTMTPAQLSLVAALGDVIMPAADDMPAASALGVPDFIDEWVSSPYEQTQDDRAACFELFEWLEQEARAQGAASFAATTLAGQQALLDRVAWSENVEPGLEDQASAFSRFRTLAVSAYFASEQGSAWLGYVGNQPALGDYAGPTEEALDHLAAALDTLGLNMPEGL